MITSSFQGLLRPFSVLRAGALAFVLTAINGYSESGAIEPTTVQEESPFSRWWDGKYATGDWFGFRDTLEDYGVKLGVEWKANFLWDVDGGLQRRFGYDDEWKFRINIDAAKLLGWEAIEGLSFYSDLRYRGGAGVNKWVGASNQFGPSTFQGGRLWRFQNAYATYTTPELFGVKEFLTISGGWQNPTDIFIKQPLNKFFLNNTFTSNRGIGANGIGWGGSYSAWGGYVNVKPTPWYYFQTGLYMAIPDTGTVSNNGLYFQGAYPASRNGLFWLTETGVTPKIGPSKLPGRYAAGFMYWGLENKSYINKFTYDQKLLFYWQADQMLFREPSRAAEVVSDGKGIADEKSFKAPVSTEKPKLSDQGLYMFNLINFAPKFNNLVPFYLQTGLVYRGLIPTRDEDQFGIALGLSNYSYYKILEDRATNEAANRTAALALAPPPPQIHSQTFEGVIEFSYRFQINKWAYIQPDLQYIFRPGGRGLVGNATVIGFQTGVTF